MSWIDGKETEYDFEEKCWNCFFGKIFHGWPLGKGTETIDIYVTCYNEKFFKTKRLKELYNFKCPHFMETEETVEKFLNTEKNEHEKLTESSENKPT